MSSLSIYIHYPFCKAKCPYCDFNSHIAKDLDKDLWVKSYLREINYFYNLTGPRKIKSIFFGGGTPSLMPISLLENILNEINKLYSIPKDIEITLEANPTSSEAEKFVQIKKAGVNRLSIGIQSLNDQDLKFLGREHSSSEAIETIKIAQKYFSNFSFDLIYARPEQTLKSWQTELTKALEIGSPHLSLYQLTIEKGTKFFSQYRDKKFTLPNDELQENLYDATCDICAKYGLENYEISNYAKHGLHSVHNLNYWQYGDYLGIGAGAHGRLTIDRVKKSFMNYHLPDKWLKEIQKQHHAIQQQEILNKDDILTEITLMGLRTIFGIDKEIFLNNFGKNHLEIFGQKLTHLKDQGLIDYNHQKLFATKKGFKLLNSINNYLLTDPTACHNAGM